MDSIEVSAKTVDEAITKACIEMGLSSDQLDINVISEGSAGFLGIGSKPAMISVRKKVTAEEAAAEKAAKKAAEAAKKQAKLAEEKAAEADETIDEGEDQEGSADGYTMSESAASEEAYPVKPKKEIVLDRTPEEIAQMKSDAEQFLAGMFKAMDLPVTIVTEYDHDNGTLDVDFQGDDMGILIGKRGQTLDSIQYLTSLVVNKNQKNYVRVKADTEDYRRRRKETLENLAKNIAYRVKKTQKPVSLEAMNPYERRIIHSALQGNRYVETHSEGTEPYRHVVVTYKRG
ncbi:MAG: RNA-binding cell elongation regulator Jag/EloR [Eubacterium sp.]|nr:RNA-binding cell elongation regulator Jag/EloR [Eubacterium sp.]